MSQKKTFIITLFMMAIILHRYVLYTKLIKVLPSLDHKKHINHN
jgi:hypothetical protein